jgi:lipoyl(octanoyl) transferase
VAAMQEELGIEIPLAEVKEKLLKHFAEVFDAVIA